MSEQLYLPGIPRPSAPRNHLFLAIFPDVSTAAHIARLASRLQATHRVSGKQLATVRFHVSLYSLGTHSGVPENIVRVSSRAAATVATSAPAFKVKFDRAVSFSGSPGNRPFVLRDNGDNAALMEFHGRLGAELGKCGFPYDGNSKFTPHVTLLYGEQNAVEESIEAVSWMVNEFVLVHSLLGRTRHITLARWMLHGQTG